LGVTFFYVIKGNVRQFDENVEPVAIVRYSLDTIFF
jgi:hypothetical protein